MGKSTDCLIIIEQLQESFFSRIPETVFDWILNRQFDKAREIALRKKAKQKED